MLGWLRKMVGWLANEMCFIHEDTGNRYVRLVGWQMRYVVHMKIQGIDVLGWLKQMVGWLANEMCSTHEDTGNRCVRLVEANG